MCGDTPTPQETRRGSWRPSTGLPVLRWRPRSTNPDRGTRRDQEDGQRTGRDHGEIVSGLPGWWLRNSVSILRAAHPSTTHGPRNRSRSLPLTTSTRGECPWEAHSWTHCTRRGGTGEGAWVTTQGGPPGTGRSGGGAGVAVAGPSRGPGGRLLARECLGTSVPWNGSRGVLGRFLAIWCEDRPGVVGVAVQSVSRWWGSGHLYTRGPTWTGGGTPYIMRGRRKPR